MTYAHFGFRHLLRTFRHERGHFGDIAGLGVKEDEDFVHGRRHGMNDEHNNGNSALDLRSELKGCH